VAVCDLARKTDICVRTGCVGQRWKWVSGSRVTASEPLTHDDEITVQYWPLFSVLGSLVDIKILLTHLLLVL